MAQIIKFPRRRLNEVDKFKSEVRKRGSKTAEVIRLRDADGVRTVEDQIIELFKNIYVDVDADTWF